MIAVSEAHMLLITNGVFVICRFPCLVPEAIFRRHRSTIRYVVALWGPARLKRSLRPIHWFYLDCSMDMPIIMHHSMLNGAVIPQACGSCTLPWLRGGICTARQRHGALECQ